MNLPQLAGMKLRTSPYVRRFAVKECGSIEHAQEKYAGICIDFAGALTDATPGARLAYPAEEQP